ncbi:MAG: helix-turn-helix domain-containing protein [Acidimicrobiales bacterium]
MELFATFPVDEVTVIDIAGSAGMTAAAVYYHFASKEQILLEGVQRFTDAMLDEVRTQLDSVADVAGLQDLMQHLLGWSRRNRSSATVYFVNSVGLNLLVEGLRRDVRIELIELLQTAVRRVLPKSKKVEAAVMAVGLVSLLETAAVSNLAQDPIYRALGARRFAAEVERILGLITGTGAA